MFSYDKATNYLASGVLGKLKADGRAIAANPKPNPTPPEIMGKPRPPYRPETVDSTGAGDSAPEPKYIPPMPPESKTTTEQCKYCDASVEVTSFIVSGYVAEDRKDNITMSAFLHGNTMIFSANFLTLEASINFCPMCGKKLTPHIIGTTSEHGDDSE